MTTREIGISCNLLPAPPLGAQPINVPTLDESFATEETDSIQDEVEDPDESSSPSSLMTLTEVI